ALTGLFAVLVPAPTSAQAAKNYAVLVGIQEYDTPKLPTLKYAESDVTALGEVLEKAGYQVTLLCDSAGKSDRSRKPTLANIEKQMDLVVEKCKKGDTVVIALSGHGMQFAGVDDSFFCPQDGRPFPDKVKTLPSLARVYTKLDQSNAGAKVL